jgi:hypothetical protein
VRAMRLVARFRPRKDADQGRPAPRPTLPPRPTLVGAPGTDISGVRPDGTGIEIAVAGTSVALLFLTGSCYGCRVLWEGAAAGGASGPHAISTVIVTPSPATEDARTVGALAPRHGIPVVMSSEAWHAYRVGRAPWWVVVAAGMVVADEMAPGSWSELVAELAGTAAGREGPAPG